MAKGECMHNVMSPDRKQSVVPVNICTSHFVYVTLIAWPICQHRRHWAKMRASVIRQTELWYVVSCFVARLLSRHCNCFAVHSAALPSLWIVCTIRLAYESSQHVYMRQFFAP